MATMGGMVSRRDPAQQLSSWLETHQFIQGNATSASTGLSPWFCAAKEGNLEILKLLAEKDATDASNEAALFVAAEYGFSDVFYWLFAHKVSKSSLEDEGERYRSVLRLKNPWGMSLLHTSAAAGRLEILQFLVAQIKAATPQLPLTDTKKMKKLSKATEKRKKAQQEESELASVFILLNEGDVDDHNVYWHAFRYGHLNVASYLLSLPRLSVQKQIPLLGSLARAIAEYGDNNTPDATKEAYGRPTCLGTSAEAEKDAFPRTSSALDLMKLLLDNDPKHVILNGPEFEDSPVFLASARGDLEMIQLFLERSRPHTQDSLLIEVSRGAASTGQKEILAFLADVHGMPLYEHCMITAIEYDCVATMRFLDERGCFPNLSMPDDTPEIHLLVGDAAEHSSASVLGWFHSRFPTWDLRYAVICAVTKPHAQRLLSELHTKGIVNLNDPDPVNLEGDTLFLACARRRLWSTLRMLHSIGCSPDWRSPVDGKCAAHFAAHAGNLDTLKWMQSIGTIFDEPPQSDSMSITGFAISSDQVDVLEWIYSLDMCSSSVSSLKSVSRNGWGLVTIAVYFGSFKCLKWLYRHGCSLEKLPYSADGTHVSMAEKRGHFKIMEWLLRKGCPCQSKGGRGEPLSTVASRSSPNLSMWIRQMKFVN